MLPWKHADQMLPCAVSKNRCSLSLKKQTQEAVQFLCIVAMETSIWAVSMHGCHENKYLGSFYAWLPRKQVICQFLCMVAKETSFLPVSMHGCHGNKSVASFYARLPWTYVSRQLRHGGTRQPRGPHLCENAVQPL